MLRSRPMTNPVLSGKRIAVIEDEVPLSTVLGFMLDELGCVQAGSARTLSAALDLADGVHADAVVMDYRLKDERSEPAALRFLERGIKVILTTGAQPDSLTCQFAPLRYHTEAIRTVQFRGSPRPGLRDSAEAIG